MSWLSYSFHQSAWCFTQYPHCEDNMSLPTKLSNRMCVPNSQMKSCSSSSTPEIYIYIYIYIYHVLSSKSVKEVHEVHRGRGVLKKRGPRGPQGEGRQEERTCAFKVALNLLALEITIESDH